MILEIHWDFSAVGVQGWTIFLIGWLVVFASLILLSSVFRLLPKFMNAALEQKVKVAEKRSFVNQKADLLPKNNTNETSSTLVEDETAAAIAMGLHLYFNKSNDEEVRVLTIEHGSRKYSPWNSKIYNVMNFKR